MTDIPIDGLPGLEPSPDEDAWDTYLTWALEQIGGNPDNGITNAQLAELEAAAGATLPFEIGLLLVHGVPDGDKWWQWNDDPTGTLARWNAQLLDGLLFDVEHNNLWLDSWGERSTDLGDRLLVATDAFTGAPQLLPLWGHRAVPLAIARDEEAAEANPVLSVHQTDVITYGTDLAAWFNCEFDVPLPTWPETAARWFPFWSELAEQN